MTIIYDYVCVFVCTWREEGETDRGRKKWIYIERVRSRKESLETRENVTKFIFFWTCYNVSPFQKIYIVRLFFYFHSLRLYFPFLAVPRRSVF